VTESRTLKEKLIPRDISWSSGMATPIRNGIGPIGLTSTLAYVGRRLHVRPAGTAVGAALDTSFCNVFCMKSIRSVDSPGNVLVT
jgi:hypothetical protein